MTVSCIKLNYCYNIIMSHTLELQKILISWPQHCIKDVDFINLFSNISSDARYGLLKRAIKNHWLMKLKRGLYLIQAPFTTSIPNLYEIAQVLYGPSHISLESALSFHQWIPE